MSDTPSNADECQRLLDAGYTVVLFANKMGSISAVAVPDAYGVGPNYADEADENNFTDDFTPSQALYRLTKKALDGVIA